MFVICIFMSDMEKWLSLFVWPVISFKWKTINAKPNDKLFKKMYLPVGRKQLPRGAQILRLKEK